MNVPALRVSGLTHRYGPRTVLDDVTFDVAPGEVVAIIGASGAGKTTLFRCITQLVRADAGTVTLGGTDLSSLSGSDLRQARRELALIFQQFNLVRRLSALENVIAGRLAELPTWRILTRRPGPAVKADAQACLAQVGLDDHADARADRLSGGQQQRVAIARALAQRSRIILADEPVSSLDPASSSTVLAALRSVARNHGITVLCNLHQVELIHGFADRVLGLRDGRIVVDVEAAQFDDDRRAQVYGPGTAASTPPTRPALSALPNAPSVQIDDILEEERHTLPPRPTPADLPSLHARGALIVDIRPVEQRARDGELQGAVIIDRNVLEWRLDPTSPDRIAVASGTDPEIVLVCNEGYASTLAAISLQRLGLTRATDLAGGYQAILATRPAPGTAPP